MSIVSSQDSEISDYRRRLQILACLGPRGLAQRIVELDSKLEEVITAAPPPKESDADEAGDGTTITPPATKGRRRRNTVPMDYCLHEAGHAVAHWYVGRVPGGGVGATEPGARSEAPGEA